MPLDRPPPPAEERSNAYLPPGPEPFVFESWQGLNTDPGRAGVGQEQAYWIDGFFPVAPRKLRTLPDVGTALYTAATGRTVEFFAFYNIGTTPYIAVFLDNGSVVQVNVNTQVQTTILPAGTIINPVVTNVGWTQWGNQYFIIVANQTNGYWIWDGNILYESGTLGPLVTLTSPGAGYATSPVIVASGGHGSGAQFIATVADGVVTGVSLVNPGSGYQAGDTVSLNFNGGTSSGTGASLTAILAHNSGGSGASIVVTSMAFFSGSGPTGIAVVVGVSIVLSGSGYSQFTVLNITIVSPGSPNTNPVLQPIITGGAITGVSIVNGGAIYYPTSSPPPPYPIITASDSGGYYVSSVTVNSAGSGYTPSAAVTASGGGSPVAQAVLSPNLVNGSIASVGVLSGGLYGSNTAPTLTVSNPSENASATAELMPFAISGTAIETYQGYVWVANGNVLYWSAPGSTTDFATSDAGGNATDASSNLKVSYQQLVSANGFLWLIGDSSVDYISGVQTSGIPATTTFTQQNADPETGSPYPASIQTFQNNVWMANSYGIHILNGSNVQKISMPLDEVWNNVANFGGLQLSSAKAIIYNKKCWMTLIRIKDPLTQAISNKVVIYSDRKWFVSAQGFASDMTYIASQEINSILTAYGTEGKTISPMFQVASSNFTKRVASKLWDAPSYMFTKAANRMFGMAYYNSTLTPNLIMSVDQQSPSLSNTFTIAGPMSTGYFIIPPQAVGQQGQLLGLTIATNAADMHLVSITLDDKIVSYRG